MQLPSLRITVNGLDFAGGEVKFIPPAHNQTATLVLQNPVIGEMAFSAGSQMPCEWDDLSIPTIMRNESPNKGKNTGKMGEVFDIYMAAYEASKKKK